MAIFAWDNSYSVGLSSVDYQHQRLVEMLNQLDDGVSTGSDEKVLRSLLKGLYNYTFYHFTTEEELMRAAGPALHEHYVEHKVIHDAFTRKIRPLAENAPLDASTLNDALLGFLVGWLVEHILGMDKEMGRLIATVSIARGEDLVPSMERLQTGRGAAERNLMGALRESELRFRSLADSVPMLIWIGDHNNRRVFFNRTWQDLTGLEAKRLKRGGWEQCIHADDLPAYREALANVIAARGELRHEYRVRRADGEYRWFLESAVPRPTREGGFIGLIGSGIDITERKAAEAVLVQARDRLEGEVAVRTAQLTEANGRLAREKDEQLALNRKLKATQGQLLQSEKLASIGQLAAGVAHEINNPIGYVKSNIATLQGYVGDLLKLVDAYADRAATLTGGEFDEVEQLRQRLDYDFLRDDIGNLLVESEEGVSRVKQIVQDLKDFSHLDQAEWKAADLNRGLQSTLNIVRNELKRKADLVQEFGDIPKIECLPQQLNQVFMNLLVNAAQAMEARGTITVRTRRQDDDVVVEIGDTGCGIPPEHLDRLYDPFFTTRPVGKGAGLGLSVAFSIVNKHGGRIEVESEIGEGTTFRVVLPMHPRHE